MDTLPSKGSSDELERNTTSVPGQEHPKSRGATKQQTNRRTPPKGGMPSKRPSTNALRTSFSTPTAITKQTTTSASKSTRVSGLGKPSPRPPAASLAHRSANNLAPPKSGSSGHIQRNSINEQQGNIETQIRELRATVSSLHESNAELRRSSSDLQLTKIKEFEYRLASSAEEIEKLKSSEAEAGRETDLVRERMATVEAERDQAQASKLAMDEALSRALDEVISLKEALGTLDKEGDAAISQKDQAEESIQKLKSQLEVAEEAAKLNEKKYGQSTFELESARTEVQELSSRLGEQAETQKLLRGNLKAQLESNLELAAQLQDSQATAKRLANEICETESALKVTTAELFKRACVQVWGLQKQTVIAMELREMRIRVRGPKHMCEPPFLKICLIRSTFLETCPVDIVLNRLKLIKHWWQMAGVVEQIRQMDQLNEEMLAEQQSFYLKLVKAEELLSPVSRSSSSSSRARYAAEQPLREGESSDSANVSHGYDESDESEV
ncbi:MAG: hypothetical protein Q9167_006303 [Letrouitia subvulpina]